MLTIVRIPRWFLLILVFAIVLSVIFLSIYPLDTPVWLVFLMIAINIVFAVPLSFLSATTGTNLGLGALVQIITGFMLPGNPNAFLFAQTLGSWALAGYGDNYVQDNKLAHYVKIAPRAVFRSQIGTIIITCFVAVCWSREPRCEAAPFYPRRGKKADTES